MNYTARIHLYKSGLLVDILRTIEPPCKYDYITVLQGAHDGVDTFAKWATSRLNSGKFPGNVGLRNSGKARHSELLHTINQVPGQGQVDVSSEVNVVNHQLARGLYQAHRDNCNSFRHIMATQFGPNTVQVHTCGSTTSVFSPFAASASGGRP